MMDIDTHLAAIYLNRFEPLAPHHVGWIQERLGYMTDDEMVAFVRTGQKPKDGEGMKIKADRCVNCGGNALDCDCPVAQVGPGE